MLEVVGGHGQEASSHRRIGFGHVLQALAFNKANGGVNDGFGCETMEIAILEEFEGKEAVRLFRLALSVDDGDPETLALAAVVSAFMVGDCEAEIEMADRAVALNPNSYSAWHYRGWVYKTAGLSEEAVRLNVPCV